MAEPFIGQIIPVGFNFAPRGWAFCDGQRLSVPEYSALFSLLGDAYGGDGRTYFNLPDLRGRVALHAGSGEGLSPHTLGQRGGEEKTTLTVKNLPSHHHTATLHARSEDAVTSKAEHGLLAAAEIYGTGNQDATMSPQSIAVADTGEGQPADNMPPFLAINWCIALTGIFPTRQ